jgi:hypothetical protein
MFVLRGVPYQLLGSDLTDVDLWLYERPSGASRRVQICDIKYKKTPKAVERLFWTSGLAKALDVDGALVATTDKRKDLHQFASKVGVRLLDGIDLARISSSDTVLFKERITDEQLLAEIKLADDEAKSKVLQQIKHRILETVTSGFGRLSLVASLGLFAEVARYVLNARSGSKQASAGGRLLYLSAAIACISLDYLNSEVAFKAPEERAQMMLDAVRYGSLSAEGGSKVLTLAIGLIERYGQGGSSEAQKVRSKIEADLGRLPAEIIAEQASKASKGNGLFAIGRELEMASCLASLPSYDHLSTSAKGMLGAMLDYSEIERMAIAERWESEPPAQSPAALTAKPPSNEIAQFGLFDDS